MKKIFLAILLFAALLTPTGCFFDSPPPEQIKLGKEFVIAQKEMSDVVKIGLDLKSRYDKGEIRKLEFFKEIAKNEKEYKEAFKAFNDVSIALAATRESGSSWLDTGKNLALIFHRTIIHSVRVALVAYFPGTLGNGIAGLLGMALGGSGTGKRKDE